MLIHDKITIGNKLLTIRKKRGLTQAETAEKANLSDRTYADIERGTANMRVDTLVNICSALGITPNDILLEEDVDFSSEEITEALKNCTAKER
ncbi:MAG: helix-turn-helix transcriptional regulator, partial [Firmicutes bacterium]|nr:helix-turn-helix transcriptional regulator [Bacillota bacterium]